MGNVEILMRRERKDGSTRYKWEAPNGRLFVVNVMPDNHFFLSEFKPNGVIVHSTEQGLQFDSTSEKSLQLQALTSQPPSIFFEALHQMSLTLDDLVPLGGGRGTGTIYLNSLEECKREITKALDEDRWYRHHDPEKASRIAQERKSSGADARESLACWESQLRNLQPKNDGRPNMMQGFSNIFGEFPKTSRDKLIRFMNAPSSQTWNDVAHLILIGGNTGWQIWRAGDPDAPFYTSPDDSWSHWPKFDDFLRYAEKVRDQEIAKAEFKIAEAKAELALLEEHDPLAPTSSTHKPELC